MRNRVVIQIRKKSVKRQIPYIGMQRDEDKFELAAYGIEDEDGDVVSGRGRT